MRSVQIRTGRTRLFIMEDKEYTGETPVLRQRDPIDGGGAGDEEIVVGGGEVADFFGKLADGAAFAGAEIDGEEGFVVAVVDDAVAGGGGIAAGGERRGFGKIDERFGRGIEKLE